MLANQSCDPHLALSVVKKEVMVQKGEIALVGQLRPHRPRCVHPPAPDQILKKKRELEEKTGAGEK